MITLVGISQHPVYLVAPKPVADPDISYGGGGGGVGRGMIAKGSVWNFGRRKLIYNTIITRTIKGRWGDEGCGAVRASAPLPRSASGNCIGKRINYI